VALGTVLSRKMGEGTIPRISNEVAKTLTLGVACVVATRDDRLQPEITRAWGIALDQDAARLEVCIRGEPDCRTLVNLRENGQLAMNVTRPTTDRSLQFKGRASVLGPPTNQQLARAQEHLARFAAGAAQVGVPPVLSPRWMGNLCAAIALDIVPAVAEHGLTVMHGSSPSVGAVGYLLNGGLSFCGRAHGLATNHVRSLEVVTPDGVARRVDPERDPDLFRALRGGGGNTAVVCGVELGLLPYATEVGGGGLGAWEACATAGRAGRECS